MSNVSQDRLIGVDLLKALVVFPIVHFHINEFIFRTNEFPLLEETFSYAFFYPYCKFMSFSGFSIVLISFFLFGFKSVKEKALLKLIPIFIAGQILVNLAFTPEGSWFLFEWDIYAYLAVSCFLLAPLTRLKQTKTALASTFLLLVLPYQFLFSSFPNFIKNPILFSYCLDGESTTWAVIPWALLPAFGYFLGKLFKDASFSKISGKELIGWGVALAVSSVYWGDFYNVPVGYSFYCFVFNRSTPSLWAHLLIIIAALRLSVVGGFNKRLGNNRFNRWVSNLMWCRKFWLCYIIQIAILGISARHSEFFFQKPWSFDVFYFAVIPVTEITCRVALTGIKLASPSSQA